jgi:hypothetical protein
MSGSVAGFNMGLMNSEVNRTGSLKLNAAAEQATINRTWTGKHPECSERVGFGYSGYVSVHEPPRIGGRPDERLHHVQARVADAAIDRHLFIGTSCSGPCAGLAVTANLAVASATEHPP